MFSRSALENIVTVLLDNALEHGNGTVTVTVGGHEGTDVTVTVDDQGTGLTDAENRVRPSSTRRARTRHRSVARRNPSAR